MNIIKNIKLARGVLLNNESILLAQDIRPDQGHYFLPGGNVETGESVKNTLVREWQEELGWKIQAGAFLGCLENKWNYNRKQDGAIVEVFEVNFLFMVEASIEVLGLNPISKEAHLEFSWKPIKNLSSFNLLSSPLKTLIPD